MEKKQDLRVIKKKKLLYNTLTLLMKDKTFEEIKVADICNMAMINRSTFYAHYEDKYDLLVDYINIIKEELVKELNKNSSSLNTREYYIKLIELLLNHIDNNRDIYTSIMINNRNSIMFDIMLSVVNNEIAKKVDEEKISNILPNDIIIKFYLGGVINLGAEYLKDKTKYTKEDMIKYLDILIPNKIK